MIYTELLNRYPITSDQIGRDGLGVVLRVLEGVLQRDTSGDIAEFGCYIGTSSLFIRRLLDRLEPSGSRRFFAYDSFAGLPEKSSADESTAGTQFQAGELTVGKRDFLQAFRKAGLRAPVTHKAWFNELSAAQLPEELAFAFLDGDFYQSILDSLKLVWPRLAAQGVVVIDDYQREALPGVTAAVRDFFHGTPAGLRFEHNIAILKKS